MSYNLNADHKSRTHSRLDALIESQEEVAQKSLAACNQEKEVYGSLAFHQDNAQEAATNTVEFNVGNYILLENSMLNTPVIVQSQPGGDLSCGVPVPFDEPIYHSQGVLPTNENMDMSNYYNPWNTLPSFIQNSCSDVPDRFVPFQQVPIFHPYSVVHPESMLQEQYFGQDWRNDEFQSRQHICEQSISVHNEAYAEGSFQNPDRRSTFSRAQGRGKFLGGTNASGNGVRSCRVSKAKKKPVAAVSVLTTADGRHSCSPAYQIDQPFSAPPRYRAASGQLANNSATQLAEYQSKVSDAISSTYVNSQVLSKEEILEAINKQPKFNVGGTQFKASHKMEYMGTCRLLRDMPVPLPNDESLEAMATHYAQSPSQKGLDWKDHILHYEQISVRLDAMSHQARAVRNEPAADAMS